RLVVDRDDDGDDVADPRNRLVGVEIGDRPRDLAGRRRIDSVADAAGGEAAANRRQARLAQELARIAAAAGQRRRQTDDQQRLSLHERHHDFFSGAAAARIRLVSLAARAASIWSRMALAALTLSLCRIETAIGSSMVASCAAAASGSILP